MTYSIVAHDPSSGQLGIAIQSRYFGAGRHVPWIESGVGVIASQAFANPVHGHEGLRLLRSGQGPDEVVTTLMRGDPGQTQRQVAIMDAQGRVAVHTGSGCVAAAGHVIGTNCCAQANMMAKDTVWSAMVRAFENAAGEIADRLVAALDAAEGEGGDIRGKQAAALIVVSGKPSGIPRLDHQVDLRVDDHPDPVGEIRRLLRYARAHHRANQALMKASASDFAGALEDLDACCAAFPDDPEFLGRRALMLLPLGRVDEARATLGRAKAIHAGGNELLLRFADAGVIPVRRQMLEPILTGL